MRCGIEVGGIGDNTWLFFVGVQCVNKAPCICCPGGGGGASGAHHDQDIPLLKEDLIPPLHMGHPQGRSSLNIQAVPRGEGHKSGEVGVRRCTVGRRKDVGESGGVRVGQLIAGILTTQNHGSTGHGVNRCEAVKHGILQLSHELFRNGTNQGLCLRGPRLVPLWQGGVSPLLAHSFLFKNCIKKLWNLIPPPPPQIFSTRPRAILQSSGPKTSPLTIYPRPSTEFTARGGGGASRSRRREGLKVAWGGGVRGK